jgi:hypothetical protein
MALDWRSIVKYQGIRGAMPVRKVTGNIIWLSDPERPRKGPSSFTESLSSLQRSLARLTRQIERSGKLKAEIATAVDDRRYELLKRSIGTGTRVAERSLVTAQCVYIRDLLRIVHSIAAEHPGSRISMTQGAPSDPLARNIRALGGRVRFAGELTRDVRAGCESRDWRRGKSALPRRQDVIASVQLGPAYHPTP